MAIRRFTPKSTTIKTRSPLNSAASRRFRRGSKSCPEPQFRWAEAIAPEAWETYQAAIQAVRDTGVEFMLGGGFALATYAGRWRDTKDIDLYIRPHERDRVVEALSRAGFEDYYRRLRYDRKWIYRSFKNDCIVDIIWAMANQRAQVDDAWFTRPGSTVRIRGEELRVLPMEEFMWCKFYILQRDHCDWTDIFNLLYCNGNHIDWDHLLNRLDEDVGLLKGLLTVYRWLCPKMANALPRSLWEKIEARERMFQSRPHKRNHIRLLDSRGWFAAAQPKGKKLEV